MSEIFSLASVYGAPKTTVEINSQFDFLGRTTVLVGYQSITYSPIEDDLVEKAIVEEEGDWLGWAGNIAIGVLVTAACVVVAVAAAPAAIVMIAGCAAVGAAVATIAVAVEDYNGGKPKPRTTGEALQEVAIGLTRGAITGAIFFYAAPVGFWETVGVGMYDGFVGSFVEQCLRGKALEPDTLEKGIEEAIVEGATCGLFWGAGKIIGKLADRFGGWLKGVEEGKSGDLSSIIKKGTISIEDIKADPSVFNGKSVDEIAQVLRESGYDVTVKASTRSRSGAQIIKINNPGSGKNISQVQVSPGGGRHGSSPYVKISTTDQGIIKIIEGPESLYKTDGKETATIIFSGGK